MLYELAPVGNAIVLQHAVTGDDPAARFKPYAATFYGSGTTALAAAIAAAIRRKPVATPEVILPAYTCPDVISAVLYAGAKPVLVDLDGLRPWMDLRQVEAQIRPGTVAIMAVNFLGLPERRAALQRLAHDVGILLIEDSAQSCPIGMAECELFAGDFVVLSFGRGKPVSLLGGGAVLSRRAELTGLLPRPVAADESRTADWKFRVRATAYNLLRKPRLYWALRAMPFLELGQTRYKPLKALAPEPRTLRTFLAPNLDQYRQLSLPAAGWIHDMLADLRPEGFVDLASECDPGMHARLLRYPVLISGADRRDDVFRALQHAGLGVSRMYRNPLPRIAGVAQTTGIRGAFPAAQAFADALLTLPTHAQVRRKDIAAARVIIAQVLREGRTASRAAAD